MLNSRSNYPRGGKRGGSRVPFRKPFIKQEYNINEYIRSQKVHVVVDGENLGLLDTKEAIEMAKSKGLDLVEVSPNMDPPVCKIMSFSKFLYEKKKKAKKARKHKQKELKEFRFGTYIGEGDRERLLKRADEFLKKGHNVKITVTRKRRTPFRESQDLLNDLLTHFQEYSTIGSRPDSEGTRISMIIKANTK